MNNGFPRRLLLGFAAVAPVWALLMWRVDIALALAPLFLSHLLLLYPTVVANSQWLGPVITCFETPKREVWLTIDDGPAATHTKRMLDLLERHQAQATFFIIGRQAQQLPELVDEIVARGHTVGNHTSTHPRGTFWCATPPRLARELDWPIPYRTSLFRAPAGIKSPFVHPLLRRRGLHLIGWSARGFDSVRSDATRVARAIAARLHPGAIILLHEGVRENSDPDYSLRCLELVLQAVTAQGYRCVVPELAQLRPRSSSSSSSN